ncbi:co-regulatory protein PtrA N-terminal domain-containing protein [Pseudomonas asplenii]|uniref:co-regulatory protein PtrA N-terminal domain-containing protein n=1 Tax=Pseudomonas asplenii TaxID=53407 RepID=UPI000367A574|nr:co-regulatory protein PtrA N-terminal domain-containing protein [Pseudomonas fuscovaginae]
MKLPTLLIAGLLSATSFAALAEGGSDRVRERWENFQASQQTAREQAAQKTLTAQAQKNDASPNEVKAVQQQPET